MTDITIGSRWMTRDGREAVVTGRVHHKAFPWRGDIGGAQVSWTETGRFYEGGAGLHNLDLVSPWIEDGPLPCLDAPVVDTVAPSAPAASGVTKQSLLEEAIAVAEQLGKSYGRPEDNFERIARRWNVHLLNRYGLEIRLDAIDVALMMDDVKSARIENDPHHHDSWVDKAGYAACGGEIAGRSR